MQILRFGYLEFNFAVTLEGFCSLKLEVHVRIWISIRGYLVIESASNNLKTLYTADLCPKIWYRGVERVENGSNARQDAEILQEPEKQ